MIKETHFLRGVFISFFLAPICLCAGLLAGWSMLNMFVSGLLPQNWFSDNAADWIWGTGSAGDAVNYFRIMFYGMITITTASAIKWGFTGEGLNS